MRAKVGQEGRRVFAIETFPTTEGCRLQIWICEARPLWTERRCSNHALINLDCTMPCPARNVWVRSARPSVRANSPSRNYDRTRDQAEWEEGEKGGGEEGGGF